MEKNVFIDSHAHLHHLDLTPYHGELKLALEAAREQGVDHILCVCITPSELPVLKEIAETYKDISISFGVHPNEVLSETLEPSEADLIELGSHPKIVALGETGLDYYRTEIGQEEQGERFRRHIRAANDLKKPLIVHTRKANEDTLAILKEEQAHHAGGVLHCFTETWEMAQKAMDMGFYISFSGIITFKNAVELQEIVKKTPLDRILIETDAPYLAPVPYRGKPNEPSYVRFVAGMIGHLKQISIEEVAQQTSQNFFDLFKVD